MKNEALEFAAYLETQLVPDFREAGMNPTANDFATAARFIRGLAALAPFTGNVAPPVSPDLIDDRRPVWSFDVDGQHVRWCGTLDQWHKDRLAYVDKSEGTWEAHGPHMWRFVEPAGPRRAKRTFTIFRAIKNK
jgi:hypothetical protein